MNSSSEIQNPIQYFEDLIYYKKLGKIKHEFEYENNHSAYCSYDKKTETWICSEQNQETGEWEIWMESFEEFIGEKTSDEAVKAVKRIDSLMLNQDSFDKKKEFLNSVLENLSFLADCLDKYPLANNYRVIKKSLDNIVKHINAKHKMHIEGRVSKKYKTISYVSPQRIEELSRIKSNEFDLSKLIQVLKELNIAYLNEAYVSCGILIRVILDHVPPIFGSPNFRTFANQECPGKTNKALMKSLEESSRKIADNLLHSTIKNKMTLPTENQVDSKKELDVLLALIIEKIQQS